MLKLSPFELKQLVNFSTFSKFYLWLHLIFHPPTKSERYSFGFVRLFSQIGSYVAVYEPVWPLCDKMGLSV